MTEAPILKELKCPHCSSPLQQRLATAQTIVCSQCHSYIGVGAEEAQELGRGRGINSAPRPIKIGDSAKLQDIDFFVMGRVLYEGWDTEDKWEWTEWLLGASTGQLMWLSHDKE